ncbi:hypothetical protein ACFLZ4_01670 [Patescibacteria group bacterium]
MILIGGLSDQTIYYVWEKISGVLSIKNPVLANFFPYEFQFRNLINPLLSNQPGLEVVVSLFTTVFGFNFLLFITLTLNLLLSYLYFKKFRNGWVYSLIFCTSAYFLSHFGKHIALSQIWVFPFFFYFLSKFEEKRQLKDTLLLGLVVALVISVSNYYGFFILLFLCIYGVTKIFFEKEQLKHAKFYLGGLLISLIISSLFLFRFFYSAYIGPNIVYSDSLNRSPDDMFTFSSRPWYFALPPVKNPFLGEFSRQVLARIESTGYFLADDYFAAEHMGNYLGLILCLFTVLISTYIYKKGPSDVKRKISILWVTSMVLFLFMLPPFITFLGLKIYTPSLLIYKLFPMFRVMARMSILLLFLILNILGLGFDFLYESFSGKKVTLRFLSVLILLATIFETFIPLKIVKMDKTPKVFDYIRESTDKSSILAVYPYSKSQDIFFWTISHKRAVLNFRDFKYEDFNAEDFTKEMVSGDGLSELRAHNVDYLVVLNDINDSDKKIFQTSPLLSLEGDFDEYLLFSVR